MRAAGALAGTIASISPQLILIALMMAAVVFFGQRFGLFGEQITLIATSAASFGGEERSVELFTLLPKDGIRSIDDPSFIPAGEAEWSPTTPVIGLSINGDARAYPLPVLAAHEIVNDVVGGSAVAVTYCPLCLTGIVFDRSVAGSVVEFGVSGKLLMNVLVMYDRATDSLWSQILREAISGPHRGTRLVVIDSLQTTWGTWRDLHPQTLILDERVRKDGYASYYRNNDSGVHGGFSDDDRLPAKEIVVGLIIGRTARAYPLALAEQYPVVNDRLNETPVLVAFGRDGQTGIVFDRRLDGRTLSFDPHPNDPGAMVDRETNSVWQRLTGRALSGPMTGRELAQQPATTSFWFGWHDFFSETTVYGIDSPGGAGFAGGTEG